MVQPHIKHSTFAKEYARRRELAHRAKIMNLLQDPEVPSFFLAWAKRTQLEVAAELVEQVERGGVVIADWEDLYHKCKEQFARLERENAQLRVEAGQAKTASDIEQSLRKSDYWRHSEQMAQQAIAQYAVWRKTVVKVQKTSNLQEWLTKTIGADNREAEFLKKVLSDFFPQLK